jgi:transposase
MLDLVDEAFDQVALLVEVLVVRNGLLSRGFGRNDRVGTKGEISPDPIGVVGAIGKHMLGGDAVDQGLGLRAVVDLTWREDQPERIAESVDGDMDFRAQPAARATDRLRFNPPLWNGPPLSPSMDRVDMGKGEAMEVRIVGVDLGKNSCSVVGLDAVGRVVLRRRVRRQGILSLVAKLPGCIVAMEACCGAHHLGRLLVAQGHEVRLMSPEYVRPYVKAQKNDDRDAEAIAEAATRPTMRFVALKTAAQLDAQVLHRVRDGLVGQRTALMNQIRSILLERGIVIAQGRRKLLEALEAVSSGSEDSRIGARMRLLLDDMLDQWRALDARITALDDEFAEMARNDPAARRLATIPGIGVLNATALVAAIGDGRTFSRARDLSAWLGLVPRQATTGGKPRLMGITKRGSTYLRKLILQGARAALPSLANRPTPIGAWLRGLLARAHVNKVVVALASKLARIAWALLRNETNFSAGSLTA